MKRRIEPVPPSAEALVRMRRILRVAGGPAHALFRLGLGVEVTASGTEHLPQEGPVFVLANHITTPDAGFITVMGKRPIQFMVAKSAMVSDFRGRVLAQFGVIPKQKFASDSTAVKTLLRWRDLDAAVGLFPEGERSWDGHTLPLIPGIGKLVRLVKAPVVTVRVLNGHRVWPRWAEKARRGRVHLEFDAPVQFARREKVEVIRKHLEDRLRVDPAEAPDWEVRGTQLAAGLKNLLHACPACNALDALQEAGDIVGCASCGASWTVDTNNRLTGHSELSVAEAWALVKERFAEHWVGDPARFAKDGTVLESEPAHMVDAMALEPTEIARGQLRLTPERVEMGEWSLPLTELKAVSVDFRRQLQFVHDGGVAEAVLPTESCLKWEWITRHWMGRLQG